MFCTKFQLKEKIQILKDKQFVHSLQIEISFKLFNKNTIFRAQKQNEPILEIIETKIRYKIESYE